MLAYTSADEPMLSVLFAVGNMLPEVLRFRNVLVPEKVWLFARYGTTVPSTASVLFAVRSPPPRIPPFAGVEIVMLLRAIVEAILASGSVPTVMLFAFIVVRLAPFAVRRNAFGIVMFELSVVIFAVMASVPSVESVIAEDETLNGAEVLAMAT
jgi:hypothetical protein